MNLTVSQRQFSSERPAFRQVLFEQVINIPFAATMVPVIRSLAATQGVDLEVLTWSLAIGTDIVNFQENMGRLGIIVIVAGVVYFILWQVYKRYMKKKNAEQEHDPNA